MCHSKNLPTLRNERASECGGRREREKEHVRLKKKKEKKLPYCAICEKCDLSFRNVFISRGKINDEVVSQ